MLCENKIWLADFHGCGLGFLTLKQICVLGKEMTQTGIPEPRKPNFLEEN